MAIHQKLGAILPVNLPFKDEAGNAVKLGDMLSGKPVVLIPVFYSCKTGCAILIDNVIKTLAKATKGDILKPGRDMDVLMYSIDPKETPELAHAKKALIFNSLTPHLRTKAETEAWRLQAENGWHLLTGDIDSVKSLSDSIGFNYSYRSVPDLDKKQRVWLINHPTCTVVLTPQGKVSTYTIGNDFQTKEIEGDLLLARQGQIGRATDQTSMFGCIMVDPATGKNRLIIENVWRLGGILTVLALGISIFTLNIKSKRANPTAEEV